VSRHLIAERRPLLRDSVAPKRVIPAILLLALLTVAACSGQPPPATEPIAPSATSFATGLPVAKALTPTFVPATPTVREPTATFVPLITPSPTPEGGARTKAIVPRIGVDVAKEMADAGEAVLVDVRTRGTFETAHIAGAISLPSDEVLDHYDQLPTDRLIIFYCA
jgi:hypothetical protein